MKIIERIKSMRITTRITLWYAVFFVIFQVIILISGFKLVDYVEMQTARVRLEEIVTDAAEDIEAAGDSYETNRGIHYYDDGVYISVYDTDGSLIVGKRPAELPGYPEFVADQNISVRDADGDSWYIYDHAAFVLGEELHIRGVVKGFTALGAMEQNFRLAIGPFALLVLLALAGGYLITRRAFEPVRSINNTVRSIRDDGDITRRIALTENHDEIDSIGMTVNEMLDVIERLVINEKQFTQDVSHELRTPITVIKTQSEYALDEPSYQTEALGVISREAARMQATVERLLLLSRSDAGRLPVNSAMMDLSELCEIIAEQQNMLYEGEITGDIEPGIKLVADEALIMRAIINLMDNARKYAAPGEIVLSLRRNNDCAVIGVTDNGPGIPDDKKSAVWERFYRGDDVHRDDGSSGLGLSIVRALVTANLGTVELGDNPSGSGACFTISLPIGEEAADE